MAKAIMIQGTMSNAGKSLLAAGLCRIFAQDGWRTAPFKSQNMALNSFITEEGLEMGRAQVVQAEAAGVKPSADMNPILLKPSSDIGSQVIVRGIPVGTMPAREYFEYKKTLIPVIREAYERLNREYDIIVIEGAGSPAEINLKQDDIVNMGLAKLVGAPVLLAGDIDRGGVFAQLYGTVMLLTPEERSRIKGLIINKFRGDKSILDPGVEMIEELCGIPVTGVVPYMQVDLEDEDSLSARLESGNSGLADGNCGLANCGTANGNCGTANGTENSEMENNKAAPDIAVIRFPRLSNFTDFNILSAEGGRVRYVDRLSLLGTPDLVILPGTKNTVEDLLWMRQNGLEAAVKKLEAAGTPVWGICGGYQMMGRRLIDRDGSESGVPGRILDGMGLFSFDTVFYPEKTRTQAQGNFQEVGGIFSGLTGLAISGYEIHMGEKTAGGGEEPSLLALSVTAGAVGMSVSQPDGDGQAGVWAENGGQADAWAENGGQAGAQAEDGGQTGAAGVNSCRTKTEGCQMGNVYGTYLHGIFDSPGVARCVLDALLEKKGCARFGGTAAFDYKAYRESQYDKLAAVLREHLDMEAIYRILEEGAG